MLTALLARTETVRLQGILDRHGARALTAREVQRLMFHRWLYLRGEYATDTTGEPVK